jgi:hypothetical protein
MLARNLQTDENSWLRMDSISLIYHASDSFLYARQSSTERKESSFFTAVRKRRNSETVRGCTQTTQKIKWSGVVLFLEIEREEKISQKGGEEKRISSSDDGKLK